MKICEITIYKAAISFKHAFGHNLATRSNSESVIVKVKSDGGLTGYGEGLPRVYVTGEDQDAAINRITGEYIERFVLREYASAEDVFKTFYKYTPERENSSNVFPGAALCAVETALLDFYSKAEGKPLYLAAGKRQTESVNYSAVLGTGRFAALIRSLLKFRLYGFKQVKVKVTGKADIKNAGYARAIMGRSCSIRADANKAWEFDEAAENIEELARSGVEAIEEPLKENSAENLSRLQEIISIPIIVDEALSSYGDGMNLIKNGFRGIFNIRLSKCGGLAQSVKLFKLAEENGLRSKMGCQVGESAILSVLGRHFAVLCPSLLYHEGSYGRHILSEDISSEDIRFSYAGKADSIEKPGLGITVIDPKIERCSEKIVIKN
jgi:muconate cycloisomerase